MKKADYRRQFDGSDRLFEYCWRKVRRLNRIGAIDSAETDLWLEQLASEAVNNEKSPFYIHG